MVTFLIQLCIHYKTAHLRAKYNDKEIIDAFKTGRDQSTLKYLYNRCFPKVKSYICANSGTTEDALDIFQDAILALCKQVRMGKYNTKYEIDGFLFVISRNLWINKTKKDKREIHLEKEQYKNNDSSDFSDYIVTPEREKIVKSILSRLGKKCAELLELSMYHKYSNREICTKMPFSSENAVKTQKYKCKQKLIGIMETYPVVKELID